MLLRASCAVLRALCWCVPSLPASCSVVSFAVLRYRSCPYFFRAVVVAVAVAVAVAVLPLPLPSGRLPQAQTVLRHFADKADQQVGFEPA